MIQKRTPGNAGIETKETDDALRYLVGLSTPGTLVEDENREVW